MEQNPTGTGIGTLNNILDALEKRTSYFDWNETYGGTKCLVDYTVHLEKKNKFHISKWEEWKVKAKQARKMKNMWRKQVHKLQKFWDETREENKELKEKYGNICLHNACLMGAAEMTNEVVNEKIKELKEENEELKEKYGNKCLQNVVYAHNNEKNKELKKKNAELNKKYLEYVKYSWENEKLKDELEKAKEKIEELEE